MTRLALLIATAGGAGRVPVAPGTAGSAVGIVIYLLTWRLPVLWQAALLAVIVVAGTWASAVAARHAGQDDPGFVVIDEVAGQLLTLFVIRAGWIGALAGFVIFRALDIVKPWPARRFEALPGGYGIMADDLMAGVYGWLIMRALSAPLLGTW
jgi:phosphatidylglycerophosphatase A